MQEIEGRVSVYEEGGKAGELFLVLGSDRDAFPVCLTLRQRV